MNEAVVTAVLACVGVLVASVLSYMAGSSKVRYDVEKLKGDVKEIRGKPCPCPMVMRHDLELNETRVVLAEIRKDLEYIKEKLG